MVNARDTSAFVLRLASYFDQVHPLLSRRPGEPSKTPDYPCLKHFFRDAGQPLADLRSRAFANIWEVAGLGTDEVRICTVLSRLWDPLFYGDQARNFLARTFALAGNASLPDQEELIAGYRISTEHCPNGDLADRVDITVETAKSIVGIEVKVLAGEGHRQLERYIDALSQRARRTHREHSHVLFLSPRPPSIATPDVTWVKWEQIAEAALTTDTIGVAAFPIEEFGRYCSSLGS